jgi:hypothetical protein
MAAFHPAKQVSVTHRSLPEFARNRRFAMSEIEGALMARSKQISPGLLGYGNASGSGAPKERDYMFFCHVESHD